MADNDFTGPVGNSLNRFIHLYEEGVRQAGAVIHVGNALATIAVITAGWAANSGFGGNISKISSDVAQATLAHTAPVARSDTPIKVTASPHRPDKVTAIINPSGPQRT